jgi:hypothetical protein
VITIQTCHLIQCDHCGLKLDYDGEPHWETPEEARSIAEGENNWWHDGIIDLCDDCRTNPHPFIADPANPSDDCWRCGNPADEHKTTEATP